MILRNVIKKNRYVDSIFLMLLANRLKSLEGIGRISAMMGAEGNKGILEESGLLEEAGRNATPSDLIIAILAESDEVVDRAVAEVDEALDQKDSGRSEDDYSPKSLDSAKNNSTNLLFCSLPGPYVRWEAKKALDAGINCMIFSDNVPVETELELKELAREKKLIVMGPDCGTAIINGTALGFANVVSRGRIGIVGASGTGIQEVTVQLHHRGEGISQAIGTGGRDLNEKIGGISMLAGIEMLEKDPATELLLLISKPPAPGIEKTILDRMAKSKKPAVICFIGGKTEEAEKRKLPAARTLEEAAQLAIATLRKKKFEPKNFDISPSEAFAIAAGESIKLAPTAHYLRGLYSGGTLADEALVLLEKSLPFHSNLSHGQKLLDNAVSEGNTIIDLGDDEFTVGVPHPMIDYTNRMERLLQEAADPEVAVILFDCVIGYGSHLNPTEPLLPAIRAAREKSKRYISFVASICGTDEDPQNLSKTREALEKIGVIVMPSNAQAARLAAMIASRGKIDFMKEEKNCHAEKL
ncbi:MAG TPA: acyl-CoA synthetase FdrA [Chroococcales cyanobacterium]